MLETLLHLSAANWARVLSLPATFAFVVACGYVTNRIARPRLPAHAIDSRNYTPPLHVHRVDYARSEITPMADGSIVAACCIQGCPIVVRIGRDLLPERFEQTAMERRS